LLFRQYLFPVADKEHALTVNEIDFAVQRPMTYTRNLTNPTKWHFVHEQPENHQILMGHFLSVRRRSNGECYPARPTFETLAA
jgi:hypothetical protein